VGCVAVLPVGPLLVYAGYAVANVAADWAGSVAGHTVASVVRPVAYIPLASARVRHARAVRGPPRLLDKPHKDSEHRRL